MDVRLRAFGGRVRHLRKCRGISQDDLANKAKLHRTYVGGIERGERNISLLNVFRLADALQVTVKELFDDDIDNKEKSE